MASRRYVTTRVALLWAVLAIAGRAATITSDFLLEVPNQNIWGDGSSATYEYESTLRALWGKSASVGGIDNTCVLGVCVRDGAKATASTTGLASIYFDLVATAGTADVRVDGSSSFIVPDDLQAGQNFKITATSQIGSTAYTTQFSNVSMTSSLTFEAHAHVSEEICVLDSCDTDSSGDLIGVNTTASLLSFDQNNDNSLKVLGYNVPLINFGKVISLPLSGVKVGDFMLNSPDIETTGVLNSKGTQLTSAGGNDNVFQLRADALNDLTDMPFSGTYNHIKVDLLEGNLGIAAGLSQSFSLNLPDDRDVRMHLLVEETGQTVSVGSTGLSQNILFPAGYQYLHIVPVYDLDVTLEGQTDVTLDPTFNINGMEIGILGEDLGPLLDESLQFNGPSIPANSSESHVRFESVQGTPFVVSLADAEAPEPGTWMLLLSSMAAVGAGRWRRKL